MAIITWENDSQILTFDVTTKEGHTSKSEPAKFPVERGVDITDHVNVKPSDVTLTVFVSNSPLHQGRPSVTEVQVLNVVSARRPIKVTPAVYDRPPGPTPGAVVTKLVSVIGDALFGDGPDITFQGSSRTVVASTVRFASSKREVNGDRRIQLLDKLEELREKKTRVNVYTAVAFYPDCLLVGISTERDKPGDGLSIDLEFSRLQEAETRRVDLPPTRVSRAKAPEVKGAPGDDAPKNTTSLFKRGVALAKKYGVDVGL